VALGVPDARPRRRGKRPRGRLPEPRAGGRGEPVGTGDGEVASDLFTARQIAFRFRTPDADRDVAVGANVRRELFLLFKEAVNNAVRHSGCTEADLELRDEPDGLVLVVSDNGRGFDVSRNADGHGLVSMRERTEGLGGVFDVLSTPGEGTLPSRSRPWQAVTVPERAGLWGVPDPWRVRDAGRTRVPRRSHGTRIS